MGLSPRFYSFFSASLKGWAVEFTTNMFAISGQEDRNILQTYIIRPEGGASGFQCSICGKNMALKHNLLNHVENIHFPGTFMYKCHICLKELKSKESLNNHHKSAHKMQNQSQSHSLKLL